MHFPLGPLMFSAAGMTLFILVLAVMIDNVLLERFPGMPSYQTCRSCSYQALCEEKEIRGV